MVLFGGLPRRLENQRRIPMWPKRILHGFPPPTPWKDSVAARIERLPLGPFPRRFITLISLGGWFDFYDIFTVARIGAALRDAGFLALKEFSAMVAAGGLTPLLTGKAFM